MYIYYLVSTLHQYELLNMINMMEYFVNNQNCRTRSSNYFSSPTTVIILYIVWNIKKYVEYQLRELVTKREGYGLKQSDSFILRYDMFYFDIVKCLEQI